MPYGGSRLHCENIVRLWRTALGAIFILNATYFFRVIGAIFVHVGLFKAGHYANASRLEAMSGPLFGGRLLAADYFLDVMCPLPWNARIVQTARYLSMIPIPLVWMGMGIAAWVQLRHWWTRREHTRSVKSHMKECGRNNVLVSRDAERSRLGIMRG